ncbi:MAG: NifU family protein [Sphingomonadales bacterium]|nr:NifU family protein [Sphingomonadales bacterium]
MLIETEKTPNPSTLKFIPDQKVMDSGSRYFGDKEEAAGSPLVAELYEVAGVTAVLLGVGFISVTLEGHDWQAKKTEVLSAIMGFYLSGEPLLSGEVSVEHAGEDSETVIQIKAILDEKIRPSIAQDGGDVVFERFEDGIVFLRLQGACAGCPSSTMTLKNGIENLLRYYVPEITEVRQAQ